MAVRAPEERAAFLARLVMAMCADDRPLDQIEGECCAQIRHAVEDEREACARVADAHVEPSGCVVDSGKIWRNGMALFIAQKIRQRAAAPEEAQPTTPTNENDARGSS